MITAHELRRRISECQRCGRVKNTNTIFVECECMDFSIGDIEIGDLVIINCMFYELTKDLNFINITSGGSLGVGLNMFDENMMFEHGNKKYKITAHYEKTWQSLPEKEQGYWISRDHVVQRKKDANMKNGSNAYNDWWCVLKDYPCPKPDFE